MELSTSTLIKLNTLATALFFALTQNEFSLIAFCLATLMLGFQAFLDQRTSKADDDSKQQIQKLKERVDAIILGQGMRRG